MALCVLLVVACPVVLALWSGGGASSGAVSSGAGWSAVPLAARGLVSAAVGAREPSFRVGHSSAAAGGLVAVNREQRLTAAFSPAGARVTSDGGGWLGLRLASVSGAGDPAGLGTARLSGGGNRVSYAYHGVDESFANGPLGLEQSFTIAGPGRGQVAHGPVVVSMALSGDLRAKLAADGVMFTRNGRPVLAYRDLLVHDARGRPIPARLALADGRIQIRIDAAGAMFPLRVDPFVQSAELTDTNGNSGDEVGTSVAVSEDGTTVVAGAPGYNVDQGEVYVFSDDAGTWSQTGALTGSDGAIAVGTSVAVSSDGSTIVTGATGNNNDQGTVYVFSGNATSGWTQTGELTASDGAANDYLGNSVAVSADGSTIVAGAPYHTPSRGKTDQGAVYVFTGNATSGWTQTGELTASDPGTNDDLGFWVGVSGSGSTVVAGAPFHTPSGGKHEQGAVYVFTDLTGDHTQSGELTVSNGQIDDSLGYSVAVSADGSTVVAGAPGEGSGKGAAYVFTDLSGDQTQTGELTASDSAAYDDLGDSVAVSADGSTIVAGAPYHTVGSNTTQGAGYVFSGNATSGWTLTGELTASDGAGRDNLGTSVGVSSGGSTVVVGAPFHTPSDGNEDQGEAYVFTPSPTVVTATATTTVSSTVTTAVSSTVSSTTTAITTTTVPSTTTATTTTTIPSTTVTTTTTTLPSTTVTTATTTVPSTVTTTRTTTVRSTVTRTVTVTVTVTSTSKGSGSRSSQSGFPTVGSPRVSGLRGRDVVLGLTVEGGERRAVSFTVGLPDGVSFTLARAKPHAVARGSGVRGPAVSRLRLAEEKPASVRFTAGAVRVVLGGGVSSVRVTVSRLRFTARLLRGIHAGTIHRLTGALTARTASGRTGTIHYTIEV